MLRTVMLRAFRAKYGTVGAFCKRKRRWCEMHRMHTGAQHAHDTGFQSHSDELALRRGSRFQSQEKGWAQPDETVACRTKPTTAHRVTLLLSYRGKPGSLPGNPGLTY